MYLHSTFSLNIFNLIFHKLVTTHFNEFNKTITIDWELCKQCNVNNDNWGRQGVTPFTVASYIYHAIYTINKCPEVVFYALMNKWDSLVWRNSPIDITIWNKLFNNSALTHDEWDKIAFPLRFINTIYTNVTTSKTKHNCHPMFFGINQKLSDFFICTNESFTKTVINQTAVKVTAYRYKQTTQELDVLQGLREETSKVIIPF